jgi:signal recognition particle GTPase
MYNNQPEWNKASTLVLEYSRKELSDYESHCLQLLVEHPSMNEDVAHNLVKDLITCSISLNAINKLIEHNNNNNYPQGSCRR